MKVFLKISIIFLFGVTNSFGQAQSIFYNEKKQLIADTSYKISRAQAKQFMSIESYLLKFFKDHLEYPEQAMDMNDSGYVIVSFKINITDTLQQVRIEKAYEKKKYLSNEVKRVFKSVHIPKSAYSKHLRNKKYFLAIRFEIGRKDYKYPGFIEIERYHNPVIRINN